MEQKFWAIFPHGLHCCNVTVGKVNTVVFQPNTIAHSLFKCPAGCHFPTPHEGHTRTSLPGSDFILPWKTKALEKSLPLPSSLCHAQGGIGCYTYVIGLLFNDCLVSLKSELYGITQVYQGPVSWLHSDRAIFI